MSEERINYQSPLYLQLREVIRGKIESGEYPPGTAIPSEHTLAETYGIHRLSVRSAISALIYEGLLKSVQGKGVFVTGEKDERDLETIGGFKQTMGQLGHKPSTRMITKALRPAGNYYGAMLQVSADAPVFYIKSADQSGMPSMQIYDYKKRETEQAAPAQAQAGVDMTQYVTWAELEKRYPGLVKGGANNEQSAV